AVPAPVQARLEHGRDLRLHHVRKRATVRPALCRCAGGQPPARGRNLRPLCRRGCIGRGRDQGGLSVTIAALQWTRQRLTGRPDTEHGQALVRMAMLVLVAAYLQVVVSGRPGVADALRLSWQLLTVEFGIGFVILGWLLARPGVSYPRRVLG